MIEPCGDNRIHAATLIALFLIFVLIGAVVSLPGPMVKAGDAADQSEDKGSERIEFLKKAIEGNVFETGKKDSSGKYEVYKYEAVTVEACSLRWREEHEVYEASRRTLREELAMTVPLSLISLASVRTDKIASPGYLVPMTTEGLKTGILHHTRIAYDDSDATESDGAGTGAGIYFFDGEVARKVASSLVSLIRSCKSKKPANP